MKTFDYARAWREVAVPAYQSLPADLRALLAYTAEASDGLSQSRDLTMPWPGDDSDYRDLRERFDKIPAEFLSEAARAIYFVGHWFPAGGDLDVPGRSSGAHWKFSHYADQSLRRRLKIHGGESNPSIDAGVGLRVIEGVLRLGYASRDMWTWEEIGPATAETVARAHTLIDALNAALPAENSVATLRSREERDSAAYVWFEELRKNGSPLWPAHWQRWVGVADRYMVEESEILRIEKPVDWARERRRVTSHRDEKIAALKAEAEGLLWLIDRQISTENVIYYNHTKKFSVGWRTPLTPAAISMWLDVLTEFPYDYEIKGYKPSVVEAREQGR